MPTPDTIAAAVARYLDSPQQRLEEAREALRRTIETTKRILTKGRE